MFKSKYLFWIGVLVLNLYRLLHFGEFIDAPHDWRQCDTAYYIWDFFKNGIDLFYPAVCWMGSHELVVLEFPLPEAIVAMGYQFFGESIPLARLIFLSFFLGVTYQFFRIVELIFDQSLAQIATLVYLALPLGIFYSRAIHVDFSALFFAYAMFHYTLRGIRDQQVKWLIIGSLFTVPAFLIKIPYAFYLALPLLLYAFRKKQLIWLLQRSLIYLFPLIIFFFWQQHVYAINSTAPDWDYILHYRKFDNNATWYFGTLWQRLQLYSWWVLLQRGLFEVLGPGGILFFIIGLWALIKKEQFSFISAWLLGIVVYVLIFFNLNFVHNYYQLPLLAPAAILIALGVTRLAEVKKIFLPVSLLFLCILNISSAERQYFKVPELEVRIGKILQEEIPEEALLVVSFGKMDCRNPKLLYRARRRGWSIEEGALRPSVIQRLFEEEGASHWAYIGDQPPSENKVPFITTLKPPKIIPLKQKNLSIFLYD